MAEPPQAREWMLNDWPLWARSDQLAPGIDWRVWLLLGGRGSGKTRTGAEWVRYAMRYAGEPLRVALVAPSLHEGRAVMIEGNSGLLAVHAGRERPHWFPSRREMVFPNGSVAQLFSAERPDLLRGPQFHLAWCDELAKWRHPKATWDMLQFGLRLGRRPRQVVTTTPKPIPLIRKLLGDPAVCVTRSRTADNVDNLAPSFLADLDALYGGSRLGRQELDGEVLDDNPDALFSRDVIDATRVAEHPDLRRIVVAVDPPVTAGEDADACGIVAAGLGEDGRGYVLADRTLRGVAPLTWARAAVKLYHELAANLVVAEVNQGGDLVANVLRTVDAALPVRAVHANRGKRLRAEPVATLYEQRRVSHVGSFPCLEDEMCAFGSDAAASGSPDRLDALVWALTELMLPRYAGDPRIRRV
jgi:phage terminase large subunit-like protein